MTDDAVDGPAIFQIRGQGIPPASQGDLGDVVAEGDDKEARRFLGDVSRVRLYDFVLSDEQVRANFEFGNTLGSAGGVVAGDVNNDSFVDNLDITPFIAALAAEDEAAFLVAFPEGSYAAADIDMNGGPNNLDITPFIGLLTAAASNAAIPEPASVMLLLLPLMAMARSRRRRCAS